jgi:PAS domain S-box-containing protein
MDTDRNLLFGVIALQADMIDPAQFIEACLLWTGRKQQALADLLVERGWISGADRGHVDYLLERKLRKHGGDVRASLAAIPDHVRHTLADLGDEDIQRSLAGPPSALATIDHVAAPAERYDRLRMHATGGIGRVWLAHDHGLGRDVALKELRPEHADHATLGARFLQEARITGQLEHPGIIPVYDLVRQGSTSPFYTMRFVKGRTLSDAARAYHEQRRSGHDDPVALPALLNAFVTVCNTVAYAHARGVIHRDLKGGNVILGDFGEVVVLDWGLAKIVGRPEDEAPALVLDAGGDSGYTLQGQALGTPAYMAPEQAAGRLELIERRTDVYGLGAILYEILTGTPPFCGPSTEEVLRMVREEAPVPPTEQWQAVPSALAAICLRALAKQPVDRPATASELAREVQGWQELERRKAEEALRESEALYHSLVENLPCVVVRKDLDGRFTFANVRFCEMVASPVEHVIGRTDRDFFPADAADRYRDGDLRAIESAGVCEIIEEVPFAGGIRYFHVLKTALHDAAGRIAGVQLIGWDITERKLAEEELRMSRERFELAVLASQDGLWDWDVARDDVWYSAQMRKMLGYDEDEFPNRPGETEKRVHPDDHARWRAALHGHITGATDHLAMEYRIRHKDGSYRWVRDRGVALRRTDGRAYRIAGSREDITERKTSEERFRSAVAAMQDGILVLDADGSIVSCNAAAERILGLSAEQIMGRTPHDPRWQAIHEDGSPFPGEVHPPMVTLRTGEPCTNVIMGVHKPDGTLTWITTNAQPLHAADGQTLDGVVASFEDITERRRIEAALRETRERLAQLRASV